MAWEGHTAMSPAAWAIGRSPRGTDGGGRRRGAGTGRAVAGAETVFSFLFLQLGRGHAEGRWLDEQNWAAKGRL